MVVSSIVLTAPNKVAAPKPWRVYSDPLFSLEASKDVDEPTELKILCGLKR